MRENSLRRVISVAQWFRARPRLDKVLYTAGVRFPPDIQNKQVWRESLSMDLNIYLNENLHSTLRRTDDGVQGEGESSFKVHRYLRALENIAKIISNENQVNRDLDDLNRL